MKHIQKESDKDDIAMATNQAYETVQVDTQCKAGNQQKELKEQNEIIYDTPAS